MISIVPTMKYGTTTTTTKTIRYYGKRSLYRKISSTTIVFSNGSNRSSYSFPFQRIDIQRPWQTVTTITRTLLSTSTDTTFRNQNNNQLYEQKQMSIRMNSNYARGDHRDDAKKQNLSMSPLLFPHLRHHKQNRSMYNPSVFAPTVFNNRSISLNTKNRQHQSLSSSTIFISNIIHEFFRWRIDNNNKVPKGFEDFFPDGIPKKTTTDEQEQEQQQQQQVDDEKKSTDQKEKSSEPGLASKDDKTGDKEQNQKKQQQQQQKKKKPLGGNDNNDDTANIPGLLVLLAIIVTLRSLMEQEDSAIGYNAEEITFTEFRNRFLLRGAVERIIVVNNRIAQVILKPEYNHQYLPNNNNYNNNSLESSSSNGMPIMMTATPGSSNSTSDSMTSTSGISMMDHTESMTTWSSGSSSDGGTNISNHDMRSSSSSSRTNRLRRSHQPWHYYFYIGNVEILEEKLAKAQASVHPEGWIEVQYVQHTNWTLELVKLLPIVASMAALYFGSRSMAGLGSSGGRGGSGGGGIGGIFSVGKSTHKKIRPEDVTVTFADVAGCDQAKLEIMEFVDFLKDSERFTKLGAKIPKGALLSGPPGTGKTLLAKATAGEAGVPFYSISGSDFIEMFVGVGPSRVRDLFKEARANAPCIVFIDEIDAVGRQRGRGGFSGGGNDERENTLNQLLVEMDGFSPTTGVVVLAGTNRIDILDQALTRPGRFDRQVVVDKPDLQGRKEIFKVHLKGIKLESDIEEYAGRLAGLTPGFAGADIANICNEAAIVAARRKADSVSMKDFEKATDRIIGGLESNKIMSPEERSIVAHHEAGHAIAGWFLEHADPLLKVTIIPRSSGALGFAQYLPKEVFLRSQDQIMDIVCMTLAGRAAEQVFFGRVTTGASDDLRRVTQIVYSMIKDYGMNARVGQLAFPASDNQNFFGKGDRPYSDAVAEAMDDEARSIVDAAYERTVNLIQQHKDDVAKVAQLLIDRETITHDDIYELVGPRPFVHDTAYQEYVTSKGLDNTNKTDTDEKQSSVDDEMKDHEENAGSGLTPGLA